MTLSRIDPDGYEREVLGSELPFLLELTARYCPPCRAIHPILERIAADGRVRVGLLDVEEAPEIATRLGIRGTPTLVLFQGGREVRRHVGTASERALRRFAGLGERA